VLPPPLPHVGSPPLTLAALEARIATPKSPPRPAATPLRAPPAVAVAAPSPLDAPRPTSVWLSGVAPPAPDAPSATATPVTLRPPNAAPAAPAPREAPPWNEDTRRALALRVGLDPPDAVTPRAADVPVLDMPRTPPRKDRRDGKAAKGTAAQAPESAGTTDELVIADAVRLLKWGKEWHELAEAIARMAGRPAVADVRRMLRTHKTDIQKQARH
jgi:hypothetical protein